MSQFEIKPRRGALESVLSKLSIKTVTPNDGGSTSKPELTVTEFAGMLGSLRHREGVDENLVELCERLAWSYLDYGSAMADLVRYVDHWGRLRFLFRYPSVQISGEMHERIAEAVVVRHLLNELSTVHQFRGAVSVGASKWGALLPHISSMVSKLNQADIELELHLRDELRGWDCFGPD